MKKAIAIFTTIMLLFVFAGSAYALGESNLNGSAVTRGSSIPTTATTLPYTASSGSGVYSYIYSNYKFKPASSNKITVAFSGNCESIVNYTLKLYSSSTNSEQPTTMVIMMNRSGAISASNAWSSLSSTTYYYGYMEKTDSSVRAAMSGKYS